MTEPNQQPTQVQHPWRTVVRTVFQTAFAIMVLLPAIVQEAGVATIPWVAGALTVTGAITRVLILPSVQDFLAKHVGWLSATGKQQ